MTHITLACAFCGTMNTVDLTKHAAGPICAECAKPFLLDRPVKVTEDHFDQTVLQSDVPVLVDFYADWCGPCRMMGPALDEIAAERAGRLVVAKVDTDQSPAISQRYNIRGIPFFGLFEGGAMVRQAVGAVGKQGLDELIG